MWNKILLALWIGAFLLATACQMASISVHTDYLSHENLASFYVGTPDPLLNTPPIGQRLIITWSIPKTYLAYENLHLSAHIRYRNREECVQVFPIKKTRGTHVFALLNEDYISKRGILSYKVELIGGGCVLLEWRHQIWVDLISLTAESNESEDELTIQ